MVASEVVGAPIETLPSNAPINVPMAASPTTFMPPLFCDVMSATPLVPIEEAAARESRFLRVGSHRHQGDRRGHDDGVAALGVIHVIRGRHRNAQDARHPISLLLDHSAVFEVGVLNVAVGVHHLSPRTIGINGGLRICRAIRAQGMLDAKIHNAISRMNMVRYFRTVISLRFIGSFGFMVSEQPQLWLISIPRLRFLIGQDAYQHPLLSGWVLAQLARKARDEQYWQWTISKSGFHRKVSRRH